MVAAKKAHPGRQLGVFFLGLVILFGLVALAGSWKPELGLDLQGGQRIILVAQDDDVSESQLEEARKIINQRVNGSGFSEAAVSTQGGSNIVVEIPGDSNQELVDIVQRQAQLRFRLVACSTLSPGPCGATSAPTTLGRAAPAGLLKAAADKKDKKGDEEKAGATESPAPSESPTATESPSPTAAPEEPATPSGDVQAALAWSANPPATWASAFSQAQCPLAERPEDDPDKPLVTCDESGIVYLLSAAVVEGTELDEADAVQEQNSLGWQVNLSLKDKGTEQFAEVSRALVNTGKLFAIVLDADVISAPTMDAEINDGNASISNQGGMPESEAKSLATSLKFGALPVAFDEDPLNETVGPSLAGDQLDAGITAGIIGLAVVMLYCLIYYRGLGLVVIASLAIAAVATYGVVLLLGEAAGFTLTLPGIAGLIVAVGIVADAFVVFFERIRDEMREGKSMRVAVESGWVRARSTRIAANTVSLLSATILYIFAVGVVKGFAFALGMSTVIDLAVFFWFTKPMMSWLAQFKFFNQGHRLSGLDAENLGMAPQVAGGSAR